MHRLFDENVPKKATNLSINSDFLAKTRALKINLSARNRGHAGNRG
ncbi:MAG: type II toxin-antitoxin system CcdA family antitoxin, partial [Gammaproteobacteria bacterium]